MAKTKIRLDFCDFWPGFNKTNNLFYNWLQERFDVEICDQPDFLIYSNPLTHVHRVHNCVKIFFCVEDFAPDFTECDYALTCHQLNAPRNLRFPYYVLGTNPQLLIKAPDEAEKLLAQKTKFCSFVFSYANHKTKIRNNFFQQLSKYKKVDSGGRAFNNIGGPIPPGANAKCNFLSAYKFNIAFENASVPGYTTEKIAEAMRARSLPIYWGNPHIDKEFNKRSFLNYFDFPSEEALIEKIIELDKDDAKYLEYAREPYFHNNIPNELFDHKRFLDFFETIFSTKITPVSQKRSVFQIGRWIAVKQNKPH